MAFTSFQFAIFFLIITGIYYAIPHRFRWMMLLLSSYYFYACAKLEYIFLLMGTTLFNYILGIVISSDVRDKKIKKGCVWSAVIINIGVLFLFKYLNFFSQSVSGLLKTVDITADIPLFHLILPVGISFYTFQSLGYILDVYNGRVTAERHFGIFALFTSFWPQLLSGPINRAGLLLPQFREPHPFDYRKVTDGLRLMLWGLFKKIVIADHLAVYVNRVYNHVGDYQGMPLIIATIFYTVQIYCDFSGYTDMARGSARVLGYDLIENFRHPYFSRSLRDFWRRWHISLSSWFRDYLYIPLGGNRVKEWRWHYNIFITFLLCGLWHGADWTFVIWGALHGGVLVLENITGGFQERLAYRLFPDKESRLNHLVQVVITFIIVCFAWLFFRANSVGDAFTILSRMFLIGNVSNLKQSGVMVVGMPSFMLMTGLILFLFIVEAWEKNGWIHERVGRFPILLRWAIYTVFVWAVLISMVFGVKQKFIYFQF